jgi:hypothetical protein
MTISVQNGSAYCYKHNIRDTTFCAKEKHIDLKKRHATWKTEKLSDAYHRIFDGAMKEYNLKQKRPERRIKNYLSQLLQKKQQKPVYELIVQVGSKNDRCDPVAGKHVLKEFVQGWKDRNPTLELIGAYYHADEEGAPHVHLDYIPVATGYKNGMKKQAGLERAFAQMNLKTKTIDGKMITGQMMWQQRERDTLIELCARHGIRIETGTAKGKKHVETELYKREQAVADKEATVEKREQDVAARETTVEKREQDVTQAEANVKELQDVAATVTEKIEKDFPDFPTTAEMRQRKEKATTKTWDWLVERYRALKKKLVAVLLNRELKKRETVNTRAKDDDYRGR